MSFHTDSILGVEIINLKLWHGKALFNQSRSIYRQQIFLTDTEQSDYFLQKKNFNKENICFVQKKTNNKQN